MPDRELFRMCYLCNKILHSQQITSMLLITYILPNPGNFRIVADTYFMFFEDTVAANCFLHTLPMHSHLFQNTCVYGILWSFLLQMNVLFMPKHFLT